MNFTNAGTQMRHVTIGVLIAFAITSIAFLAYSLLVTYTNMSESSLPMVVAVTTLISVLVAGFDAAKGATSRGWAWGIGAGVLYVLVLVIIMMVLIPEFAVDSRTFTIIAIGLVGGGIGGMLGINLKK